jgi:hypothetical protein
VSEEAGGTRVVAAETGTDQLQGEDTAGEKLLTLANTALILPTWFNLLTGMEKMARIQPLVEA